jgi:hypothetical protein
MYIHPVINIQNKPAKIPDTGGNDLRFLIPQIGKKTFLPDSYRNYSILNFELVKKIADYRENAIEPVALFLSNAQDEREITEGLYILDRMIDAGVKGIEKTYPVISRFNKTNSPNIQAMLAGIYRKTQIPDGFGPLMSMLVKNTFYPARSSFDPNEEIGGAVLEYLKSSALSGIQTTGQNINKNSAQ